MLVKINRKKTHKATTERFDHWC